MKKRQQKKLLKRIGRKMHDQVVFTHVEKKAFDRKAESIFCSALCKFRMQEFDAGTIYGDGYLVRLQSMMQETLTIENITGVPK